jgi:two-component sensor histidine kinase
MGIFDFSPPRMMRMDQFDISSEIKKLKDEFEAANKKLAFENEEKEKRAAELIVANKKLIFENEEKEKRAAELIVANKKLVFENEEKEKRAAELIVANKKLVFENEEKEKRAAEATIAGKKIELSLVEKDILLKEIHHRVKNNLQVIVSLLNLQASSETNAEVINSLRDSQRRVDVMARLHESLYQSENLSTISIRDYLAAIANDLLVSLNIEGLEIAHQIHIENISFDISQSIALGQIVSELISNCFKHAFVGRQFGNIKLTLRRVEDEKIMLTLSNDGKGFPKNYDIQSNKTLGLRLVKGLAQQLHGSLSIDDADGACIKIQFPEKKV